MNVLVQKILEHTIILIVKQTYSPRFIHAKLCGYGLFFCSDSILTRTHTVPLALTFPLTLALSNAFNRIF